MSTPSPAIEHMNAAFAPSYASPHLAEPSYDLFSPAPSSFGPRYRSDSAASSDGYERVSHDYMHQPPRSATMGYSPGGARQPNQYELMNAMTALRGASGPLTPSDRAQASASFGFTVADTVSPNAVNKVSEAFAPEPSFAELMMDRQDEYNSPTGYNSRFPRYVDASGASSASSSRLASPASAMRMHSEHQFGPQADMAFRMPIADNSFSRPMHRLQYPDASSGADLQSFVRYVILLFAPLPEADEFFQPISRLVHQQPKPARCRRSYHHRHVKQSRPKELWYRKTVRHVHLFLVSGP